MKVDLDDILKGLTSIPELGPWIKILIMLKDAFSGDADEALKSIRKMELDLRSARDRRMGLDDD